MNNIFFIADCHFGHQSICTTFKRADGSPVRPFSCAEECDAAIEKNWNARVNPKDRIYVVGDVAMSKKHLPILERLNGRKVLIKGNHDIEKLSVYTKYFDDIRGSHQLSGCIITHIPIHPDSLARWGFNIHGHLHTNSVMMQDPGEYQTLRVKDPRYFCVSVEQINYTPISLEEIKKHKPQLD